MVGVGESSSSNDGSGRRRRRRNPAPALLFVALGPDRPSLQLSLPLQLGVVKAASITQRPSTIGAPSPFRRVDPIAAVASSGRCGTLKGGSGQQTVGTKTRADEKKPSSTGAMGGRGNRNLHHASSSPRQHQMGPLLHRTSWSRPRRHRGPSAFLASRSGRSAAPIPGRFPASV